MSVIGFLTTLSTAHHSARAYESIKTTIDLYAHLVPEDFAKELAALGL